MADNELSIFMRLRGARRVNSELDGTAASIQRVERAAKRSARPIAQMGRHMDRTGTVLTRRLSMPLAVAGGVATKMAFDYEESMTRVSTLTDASATQVEKWNKQILELAKVTGVAPRDLAEGLFFVASSGLALNKVMTAMPTIAKGVALGLGDTETVAQLVTSAMNAYANSGLTAAKTMDILIGGTKAGKLEAADLAESLGRVLPIASRLGVPLEQVVASMEAMSMTGTDADTAATQVSAFFSALIKTQPKAKKALDKVGLSAAGLRENLADPKVGLLGVVKILDKAFAGNIEGMAAAFPNIRALRAQLGLTGDQAKNVQRVFDGTVDSAGATGEAWAKLGESDAFKLRKGIVAIQVAAIRLGEMLAPTVTRIAAGVEKLAEAFSGHGQLGLSVMMALIMLGPVVKIAAFGFKILAARMFMTRMAAMGVQTGMFAATASTFGFSAALLASPITWIVLGIAAIAGGLYLLNRRTGWVTAAWEKLNPFVRRAGEHFRDTKQDVIEVVDAMKRLWKWVKNLTATEWVVKITAKLPGSGMSGIDLFKKIGENVDTLGDIGRKNPVLRGKRALGGPVHASGGYLVGERGPEIVRLPVGAHVTSNDKLGGREMITAPIVLKLDGRTVAETTARVVADRKARK